MRRFHNENFLPGILLVLLGMTTFLTARALPNLSLSNDPGPALFPCFAGIGLAVCGIGVIFQSKRQHSPFLSPQGWRRLFFLAFVVASYAVALSIIGFRLATPPFVYITMRMLGHAKESYLMRVVVSIGVTILLDYLFQSSFKMPLPSGIVAFF